MKMRLLCTLLALASLAGTSFAQTAEPVLGRHSDVVINGTSGKRLSGPNAVNANTVVYDATNYVTSGANGYGVGGSSTTDLNAIYGDDCVMLTSAVGSNLSTLKFVVFCSSSSAAALTSATENINIYDTATSSFIGGFSCTLGALTKGYYSVYTVSNLETSLSTPITFGVNDVLITQKLSSVVGATRMGTVFGNNNTATAPAVGTSPAGLYISTSTQSAGYYTFTGYSANSNGVYYVDVAAAPVPTRSESWGKLKSLYR